MHERVPLGDDDGHIETLSGPGPRNATLTFTTSAPEGTRLLELQGIGDAPGALKVNPTALGLIAPLGTPSPLGRVTVTNPGNKRIRVSSITSSSTAFSIVKNGCEGRILAPSSSCDLYVSFGEASRGEYSATLSIIDSTGSVLAVDLTGGVRSPEVLPPSTPLEL